jgi:alpha-ribazole phosphatase
VALNDSGKLHVLRHAPAVVTGICYGRSDVAVTPEATEAASRVLPSLPRKLERIFSSPTERARSLAEQLAERTGLPLSVDSRLRELHFGAWEGRSWQQVHETDGPRLAHWAEAPMERAPPEGETGHELVARIQDFLEAHPPSEALLVCHAGPIRVLRALFQIDAPAKHALRLDFTIPVLPLTLETLVPPPRTPDRNPSAKISLEPGKPNEKT